MGKFVPSNKIAGVDWQHWQNDNGTYSNETVTHALLMDIRSELRRLNSLLHCSNFVAVPSILREISKHTKKRRKPRAVGKPKLRVIART